METATKIVPDTSIIIEGKISKMLESGKLKNVEIILSRIVLDELESQANRGLEIGFSGLREVKLLREFGNGNALTIEGVRPSSDEIRLAKKGRLDALIRDLAKQKKGTLYTQDLVQAEVAKAEGIDVVYFKPRESAKMPLEKYFTDDTMSIHLKDGIVPMAKRGTPANITLVSIGEKRMETKEMETLAEEIINLTRHRKDAKIEISRHGGEIVQIQNYRIAIARPPFSSALEITAVRPIVKFSLDDYKLDEKLMERLKTKAEGLLITGPPGSGKTTFAQSLAEFYWKNGKIVK
ncbi:MAG: Flp pilus assembly complex ATPase component TadA, partial [Candidatus Aenigmarchaeota archaeon]|nr:Flp pilus assembly complex ATPase component TadA [Candidatus Aenigmarchaeota archaeon]